MDYDRDKPGIDAQLNAVVVDFLNTNNIKYRKDYGDENAAKEGIKKLVKVLLFINKCRSTLENGQKLKFRRPLFNAIR